MGETQSSKSAIVRRTGERRRVADTDMAAALRALIDQMDVGVVFIDRDSRILYGNARAWDLVAGDAFLTIRRGRLYLGADPARRAVASGPCAGSGNARLHSWEISRPDVRARRCATMSGLGLRRAGDPVAVLIYGFDTGRRVDPALLRELYGLTPAEAQAAAGVFDGHTPLEIAERLQVSINTIRSHVKRVFQKCEVRSQVQLVRLLGAGPCVALPPE